MSKFKIVKSPILDKYGLFDLNGNQVLPFKFDFIFKIVDDGYIIIGKKDAFSINTSSEEAFVSEYFHRYTYGLVDTTGNVLFKPYNELLWVNNDTIYTHRGGVTNERNFKQQYLWHSKAGSIFLNNPIIYQTHDLAVVEVWEDNIPGRGSGDFKYVVYDTDLNITKEFLSLKSLKDTLIFKKTPWSDVINIFPGITFLTPPNWSAFHFIESNCRDENRWWGELEINEQTFSLIKEYHLFNNHFLQIILRDGSTFLFNDSGKIIYHSEGPITIQTMGYCLNRVVINGTLILDTDGVKYQIESHLQHMKSYVADGNGFIKIIDVPNVDMRVNKFSMPFNYYGVMDIYGKEIIPPIFPRPQYTDTYIEECGTKYSHRPDSSEAFEGDPDAFWNID